MRDAGRDQGGYGGGCLRGGGLPLEPGELLAEQRGRHTLASAHEIQAVATLRELQGAATQKLPAHRRVEPEQDLAGPRGPQLLHAWGQEESRDGYSTCWIGAATLSMQMKVFKFKTVITAIYYKINTSNYYHCISVSYGFRVVLYFYHKNRIES